MNTRNTLASAMLASLALMGLGCNPFAGVQEKINQKIGEAIVEKGMEAASGGKLDIDAEGGSFNVTDPKTGETISLGMGAKIPAGFPTDIPRYEGSIASIASLSGDKKRAVLAVTVTGVDSDELAVWYEKAILANGFEKKTDTNVSEAFFSEYAKGNVKMIMAIIGQRTDDGQNAASIQITREEEAN
ncbi:hypothetical protein IT407_02070 [Candidatus Uhrbacteria bacterium]|nr:hypothetical protein [Candidatus Uhrbacteria bacterium]